MARETQRITVSDFVIVLIITALVSALLFVITYGCMIIVRAPLIELKATNASFYYIEGEPQKVNVSELIHAYEVNPPEANARYGGRHVRIRGLFRQAIEKEDVLYFRIGDQNTWSPKSLKCRLSASSSMLFKLNRGDVIEVGGILQGSGSFENVLLLKPYITLIKRETDKTPE